jgi:hypothetical protein
MEKFSPLGLALKCLTSPRTSKFLLGVILTCGPGFAGYLRRFSVYPVKALWPTILPTIAMNRALTQAEPKENINGWTVSRYRCAFSDSNFSSK